MAFPQSLSTAATLNSFVAFGKRLLSLVAPWIVNLNRKQLCQLSRSPSSESKTGDRGRAQHARI